MYTMFVFQSGLPVQRYLLLLLCIKVLVNRAQRAFKKSGTRPLCSTFLFLETNIAFSERTLGFNNANSKKVLRGPIGRQMRSIKGRGIPGDVKS